MSRIGKQPVNVPEKVVVDIKGHDVKVKGPNGELECKFNDKVIIDKKDNTIVVSPVENSRVSRSMWGLSRTLINNMIVGVTTGFTKKLEFSGVGYKVTVSGESLNLSLGYSHPIEYKIPKGIKIATKGNTIEVSGASKELVGFVSAKIREFRPPEPYKGKGIKYADEVIVRKAGKTGAKK